MLIVDGSDASASSLNNYISTTNIARTYMFLLTDLVLFPSP